MHPFRKTGPYSSSQCYCHADRIQKIGAGKGSTLEANGILFTSEGAGFVTVQETEGLTISLLIKDSRSIKKYNLDST